MKLHTLVVGKSRFNKRTTPILKREPWLPKGVSLLEYELTEILSRHCGERNLTGCGEGAVETLCRIIQERDRAMTLLALDRLLGK